MKTYQQELISMFQDANRLLFYKIMHYPVPKDYKYFCDNTNNKIHIALPKTKTQKHKDKSNPPAIWKDKFSRHYKNQHHDEYIQHIQKYKNLYRSIPFIEEIYLCNSISFNGLKEGSDIDLFIITKKNALRRARFFSVSFFFIKGILRKKKSSKKFCLSFYITPEAKNLYNISLHQTDIYLAYRITHLFPLYQEHTHNNHTLHQHNPRIQSILPNTNDFHHIKLGIPKYTWKTFLKKTIEYLFWGFIGLGLEKLIKSIRLPIVITKKKILWEKGKWIVISKYMLKFYQDKRQKFHFFYQQEKKKKNL